MIKLLILGTLLVMSSVFAQGRPATTSYTCQMSRYSCNVYANREPVEVKARSLSMAENICRNLAARRSMNFCAVSRDNQIPNQNLYEYRCQLTTGFCGNNGGRYGLWVTSDNQRDALRQCSEEARNRGDQFCQISEVRPAQVSNQYVCSIAMRSCSEPLVSLLGATSLSQAQDLCVERARNRNTQFCSVRRL